MCPPPNPSEPRGFGKIKHTLQRAFFLARELAVGHQHSSHQCSNTSRNCWRNVSKVGKAEPSILQTAVAHSNALPVSNEQTKAVRLESVGYSEGCWLTKSEHSSRKPLHLADSPSNFSEKASRGFIEGT